MLQIEVTEAEKNKMIRDKIDKIINRENKKDMWCVRVVSKVKI